MDARCRDLTSAAACEKGRKTPGSVPLCQWHEVSLQNEPHACFFLFFSFLLTCHKELGKLEPGNLIPSGIWTLADVQQYGRENTLCPYFTIRRMVGGF